MTSVFDTDVFLGTTYTEENDTTFTPLPEGDYLATIGPDEDDLKLATGVSERGVWARLELQWYVDDPELAEKMGMQQLRVKQSLFLDLEGNPPRLAMGRNRNIKLGRVRKAVGQNTGRDWDIGQLRGAGPARIIVDQTASREDPEQIFNNVVRVVAA